MQRLLSSLAVAAAIVAAPASAATLVQTADVAAASAPTSVFGLNKFDTSLGTLTGVTLAFTGNMTASGSVTNTANAPATRTFTLTQGAIAGLTGGGFDLSADLGLGSSSVTVPHKGTIALGPYSGSGSDTADLFSGLDAFLGLGTIDFTFSRDSLFALSNGPGHLDLTPLIGGHVTLTYNYDLPVVHDGGGDTGQPGGPMGVPEPGAWALMILGFGAAGVMLRRRQATFA